MGVSFSLRNVLFSKGYQGIVNCEPSEESAGFHSAVSNPASSTAGGP